MLRRLQKDPVKYAIDLAIASLFWNAAMTVFVILMWNSYGEISKTSHIAVGLTAIEIFLIVVAFSGFWMLRGIVANTAIDVSGEVAKETAKQRFDQMQPEIRRLVEQLVNDELQERTAPGEQSQQATTQGYDIAKAMAEDDSDEQ